MRPLSCRPRPGCRSAVDGDGHAVLMRVARWVSRRWLRVSRPGSVLGPQQYYLEDVQDEYWRQADRLGVVRKAHSSEAILPFPASPFRCRVSVCYRFCFLFYVLCLSMMHTEAMLMVIAVVALLVC